MQAISFTTKVATPETFCNREKEKLQLSNNIQKGQHTVVVAPRRYGKTSLICHVLEKEKLPCAIIDFFCVVYADDVCQKIAKAISTLIQQITPFSEKAIKLLSQYFKNVSFSFKAGQLELNIDLQKAKQNLPQELEELLQSLELFAKKHKQAVVLFFDEFQDILKVDETNKLQASIRAAAQHAKYVTYIFSGSSRTMLNAIFDDKKQPLYMLCQKMQLERIKPEHFAKHIQAAAKKHWKKLLPETIIEKILTLTETHSYYVNLLCDKLWNLKTIPEEKDIEFAWQECLNENLGKIAADLTPLTTNRLKVLSTIALQDAVMEPNSKTFLDLVKLPLSSVQKAMQYLLDHDYIFKSAKGLQVVDPLIKKFIQDKYTDRP